MTASCAGRPEWRWLGAFTVRIDWAGGRRLYIDPWRLKENAPPADVVLLTNPRAGHTSRADVESILGPKTIVGGPPAALARLGGLLRDIRPLVPGAMCDLKGAWVRAVSAGNRDLSFFPREALWLGYVIDVDGLVLYHAGATDRIPEIAEVRADVAFVPVSGRYLMGEEEALAVARGTGARTRVALFPAGDRFRPCEGFVVSETE